MTSTVHGEKRAAAEISQMVEAQQDQQAEEPSTSDFFRKLLAGVLGGLLVRA